jgi:hypothetical protein
MASTCAKVYQIPGPQGPAGADGADGANGTNGVNAYTLLDGTLTMPGELLNVNATVDDTSWMAIGQIVFVQTLGHMQVVTVLSGTQVTLKNLKDTANDAYLSNAAPGTVAPDNSVVSPAGLQGPGGTTSGAYLEIANNLGDGGLVPATCRTNLGATTVGSNFFTLPNPSAIRFVQVDAANTVTLLSDTNFRTAIGLGTIATQAASAVAITGGTATGITNLGASGGTLSGMTSVGTAALPVTGAASFSATSTVTMAGKWILTPLALQTVGAGDTIQTDAAKIRVAGSGGAVTMTSTPTLEAGTEGQMLLILGTHATNTVTLQADSSVAGTKLMLGATTRALGLGDQILLSWDATIAMWCEVSFVNNS